MRVLIVAAVLAVATASVVTEGNYSYNVVIGRESLVTVDVKVKEICIMKLMNYILQPTVYEDIREVARNYVLENNMDKYSKSDVVMKFMSTFKMGMLPRSEVFVHTNELQMEEAVKVFRILYFAKDFDYFIKTACWLRERINGGMFVYAMTAAVFHRSDCVGISLPAPYEIYPYFFVDSHVINKAFMMKMTKAATDPVVMNYYGIQVSQKNVVVIDWRKGVRRTLAEEEKYSYFTEDIDLNTYMYYLHMSYPYWMTDEEYGLNKERRGEILMYTNSQLLARLRMERLGHKMCDINRFTWNEPVESGYWPKIRMHTGDEMPVRQNNFVPLTSMNLKLKMLLDDTEQMIRQGIFTGKIERRDGTVISLKNPEDVEMLARLILGGMNLGADDAKMFHMMTMLRKMLSYSQYNINKYTYVPTALDMYTTCLRDPVFWKIMKRVMDTFELFKTMLSKYTREEFDFPGVKVEHIETEKLVTFMDKYDVDITNALYLDQAEIQMKKSDMVYVARLRRLNHQPFKVSINVTSYKSVHAVVRVFIGPKYDCMGRLISVNDKRLHMLEIDSFVYKLESGTNTIVRSSLEMQGVIQQRPWTKNILEKGFETTGTGFISNESWWYKSRLGFPHRLLLPLGTVSGMSLQVFVIVTPAKTGMVLPFIDMSTMKARHACRWSVCFDTMPLGFPFDREIDMTSFYTSNMKFTDVKVYRKDLSNTSNYSSDVDVSDMVMKRDDLTYLDSDMLVSRRYKDVMLMNSDNVTKM